MNFMRINDWDEKENESLPYVKNDVLSIAFSYARYSKSLEELIGFGMKNSLTLRSLAKKYNKKLRDKNNEPIYTYNDEFMRHFVRQSLNGGRCAAFNQYYKSSFSDELFKTMPQVLNIMRDFR